MTETVLSLNQIPIRLTAERWAHIVEEHCELAGLCLEVLETVTGPEAVPAGGAGELLATREITPENIWRWFIGNWRTTVSSSLLS
jgi:hypothetical protein